MKHKDKNVRYYVAIVLSIPLRMKQVTDMYRTLFDGQYAFNSFEDETIDRYLEEYLEERKRLSIPLRMKQRKNRGSKSKPPHLLSIPLRMKHKWNSTDRTDIILPFNSFEDETSQVSQGGTHGTSFQFL